MQGPLGSCYHLEKENIDARMGFSEARGLGLELWAELTGNEGRMGTGAWATLLRLLLSPYAAGGPRSFSSDRHWNSRSTVIRGSGPCQQWQKN